MRRRPLTSQTPAMRAGSPTSRTRRVGQTGGSGGACGGTSDPAPEPTDEGDGGEDCHPSYPDFCIEPPPPDLDCPDMEQKNFTVGWDVSDPDPHGFDGNKGGVGCEA